MKKKTRSAKNMSSKFGGMILPPLEPITANQKRVIDEYEAGKCLVIHGAAGTGKSFLACNLAISSILRAEFNRLVIYRSAVPSRDMGFVKGDIAEKQAPYEAPYREIFAEVFSRGDAYDVFKHSETVEFSTTSYIRGLTLKNSIVLIDEAQNMTFHELDSLMTRVGDGTRIIFCGDTAQTDLQKKHETEGFTQFMEIARQMPEFRMIEMGIEDVVRSGIVKSYLKAKVQHTSSSPGRDA